MCTSVRPAGGGSVGAFFAEVFDAPASALLVVVVAVLPGVVCAGAVEADALSITGVDDASVGVDEAIVSTCDVDVAAASVDVAATCASTGLTMANPMTRAAVSALAATNLTMLYFMVFRF